MFGPTLVRPADDNMMSMVTDMSQQCRIIESILSHFEWFFSDEEDLDEEVSDKRRLFIKKYRRFFTTGLFWVYFKPFLEWLRSIFVNQYCRSIFIG